MKKSLTTRLAAVLAMGACALGGLPASAIAAPAPVTSKVITTFAPGPGGAFAESMARFRDGGLIVSLTQWGVEQPDGSWTDNEGQLYRVATTGKQTAFGPRINLGPCSQLMGVAVDSAGRVFVAVGNFDASCGPSSLPSGVLRVTRKSATRVLTMPSGTFANGLAIHQHTLYVTDSSGDDVWTGPTRRASTPARPWFSSAELGTTDEISIGADGIAYRGGSLYVTGYARGFVLSVRIDHKGRPTRAHVLAHDARLVGADGIAFGAHGKLWVAVNPRVDLKTMTQTGDGALAVINTRGKVSMVSTPAHTLDYPTQPIVAGTSVYVANGAFVSGTPSVTRFTHLR